MADSPQPPSESAGSGKIPHDEVDPLLCPRCAGPMQIISFIDDPHVIKTILVHLRLWETPARPPPASLSPPDTVCDYEFFDDLLS